jgi:hypothetical protein
MVRRSFRLGLRLGLLCGIGFALFKTMQSRRTTVGEGAGPVVEPGSWEPLRPDAAEQPRTSTDPRAGAGSSPANVRPAQPPRPAAPNPPPSLRMPDVPSTPPSAASEGRAATSTPATPAPPVVDEVGEPILEPAPPIEPAPSPRRPRTRATPAAKRSPSSGAAEGTPPEKKLLKADPAPAPDPVLDVPIGDDIVPARPVKKAAAKKAAAAAAPAPAKSPTRSDEAAPGGARPKKVAKKATKATKKAAALPAWVEAQDGACPPTHPVKAKLASKLFHLPGMFAYARTRPDRCYLDADTAVAEGFTAAKR